MVYAASFSVVFSHYGVPLYLVRAAGCGAHWHSRVWAAVLPGSAGLGKALGHPLALRVPSCACCSVGE